MANEFVIKNGFHSKGNSQITGSLGIPGFTDVSASLAAAASIPTLQEVVDQGSSTTTAITASAISSSTLSSNSDLTLDADGADIILKDGGNEFGRFKRDNSDFIIKSATQDKDIVFRGNDGGGTVDALTLDMSDGGKGIFTAGLIVSGSTIFKPTTNIAASIEFSTAAYSGQYNPTITLKNHSGQKTVHIGHSINDGLLELYNSSGTRVVSIQEHFQAFSPPGGISSGYGTYFGVTSSVSPSVASPDSYVKISHDGYSAVPYSILQLNKKGTFAGSGSITLQGIMNSNGNSAPSVNITSVNGNRVVNFGGPGFVNANNVHNNYLKYGLQVGGDFTGNSSNMALTDGSLIMSGSTGGFSVKSVSSEAEIKTNDGDTTLTLGTTSSFSYVTASAFKGDGSQLTGIDTGSAFPFTGDAQITGSLTISGSFEAFKLDADDIVLGSGAGEGMTSSDQNNIIVGTNAVGSGNINGIVDTIAIGHSAGYNLTTGDNNILIGSGSGDTLTTGYGNLMIGDQTDASTSGTYYSIVIGTDASITGGTGGVAIGRNSVSTNNSVAIGSGANTSHTQTVTIGQGADSNSARGVAIGQSARQDGYGGIAIGYSVTSNASTGVAIGYNLSNTLSNSFQWGSSGQKFTVTTNSNLLLNNLVDPTAVTHFDDSATNVITIGTGSAPDANVAHSVQLYAQTGSSEAGLQLRTSGGKIHTLADKVDFTTATAISGSTFSGSFVGDGSGLTGTGTVVVANSGTGDTLSNITIDGVGYDLTAGTVTSTNGASDRIATFNSTTLLNGEANLTFDGSTFKVVGDTQMTGSLNTSGSSEIIGSGSGIFSVEGSVGSLFTVNDGLDDVIFAANNISGTPVIEASADNTVKLGKLGGFGIVISGSTPAPSDALANIIITGSIQHSGSYGLGVAASTTLGRFDASNDVVAFSTSDERLKENVTPIENALNKVSQIQGVEFDWKSLSDEEKRSIHGNEGHDVGVIAQEVEKVLPEVVTTRDNGYKAVKYEKIIPLLVEAIKELQAEVQELKKYK